MTIILPLNNLFNELFPDYNKDKKSLKGLLEKEYTVNGITPTVEFKEDSAIIHIDTNKVEKSLKEFQHLVSLCENRKFEEAENVAKTLISKDPTNSEYYRLLGQIYSELGNTEESINHLIDALKWNPKNEWALLMMGNVFAKEKNDISTALVYYNQVLQEKPDDEITLCNIGAVLIQSGKPEEAQEYFNKALKANPNYPNAYLALGLLAQRESAHLKAFLNAIEGLKHSSSGIPIYDQCFQLAVISAEEYSTEEKGEKFISDLKRELEKKGKRKIIVQENNDISTAAKIEFAENYDRDFHVIKYKAQYPAVAHLILHELEHLSLVLEARHEDENQLFTSNSSHSSKFIQSLQKEVSNLRKKAIPPEAIKNYLQAIFEGMNSQLFNTPIDLFIEDRIHGRSKQLHPIQFYSLLNLLKEGIKSNTDKEVVNLSPSSIVSKSKILNLVSAQLFKNLYGVDLIKDFQPTKSEIRKAEELFEEFLEYRQDKEAGEEYEIIQHWGEDLKLDGFFDLIPEQEYKRPSLDSVMNKLNNDPLGLDEEDSSNKRKMKKFIREHASEEINMAVIMYMISALEILEDKSEEEVKKIAFEFATLGMTGIDPKEDGYTIPSFPNQKFSGYKALAYYYVSWSLAMPEMVSQLQMPFDKEFALAQQFKQQ